MRITEILRAKNEDLIPFVIFLGMTIIFFVEMAIKRHITLNFVLVLELVILAILFFLSMIFAGFVVFRSLFKIAAGFSLLNLLTQSYCSLPLHAAQNNRGMILILTFGFGYLVLDFFRSLYKDLLERKQKFSGTMQQQWKVIAFIIVSLILIVLLIYNLYEVTSPIVSNWCVFK